MGDLNCVVLTQIVPSVEGGLGAELREGGGGGGIMLSRIRIRIGLFVSVGQVTAQLEHKDPGCIHFP